MKKWIIFFAHAFFCLAAYSQGQIIGSFPEMDGGVEGQTAGVCATNASIATGVQKTAYTNNGTSGNTSVVNNSAIARSGSKYLSWDCSSTSNIFYSPTAANGAIVNSTSYTVQFFYQKHPAASARTFTMGVCTDGTNGSSTANTATTLAATTWTLEQLTVSSGSSSNSPKYGLLSFKPNGGSFSGVPYLIDDICIYAGAADNTPPADPTAPTATNPTISSLDISWTAPGSGVDGGGYVVVRYTVDPDAPAQPAPNSHGIYAVGNTVGAGTIAFIGTGTSFTDGGLSANTLYYYRVYVADKAFNYSLTPPVTSGLTAVPGPVVVNITSPAQTGAATIGQGTTNNIIYTFQSSVSGNVTTLNSVSFPNTNGTYNATDFSNFKLWYNSTNSGPGSGAVVLQTITSPSNATPQTFNGFTKTIYGTGYFWITADVAATATPNNTITVTPGLIPANFGFTVAPATLTSTATAAGTKTIIFATVASDYFRSNATANWAINTTWLSSHDNITYYPATAAPTTAAILVTVISPHIVTISAATDMPATVVNSGGEIAFSTSGSVNSYVSTVTVNGKISNYNTSLTAFPNTNTQLNFGATGYYTYDGGGAATNALIPAATWNPASTGYITGLGALTTNGITARTPGGTGKFGNLIFHNPNLSGSPKFFGSNWANPTNVNVAGSLTLGSLGTATSPLQVTTGATASFNVDGDLNVYAGNWGFATYAVTTNIVVGGSVNIDATNATYSTSNASINLASNASGVTNLSVAGDFYMKSGAFTASLARTNGTATVTFNGGTQNATFEEASTTGIIGFTINNTALNLLSNLTVQGTLTLTAGTFNLNNYTLTFHTNNTPIAKTAGFLSVGSGSSLAFGIAGNTAGNAFTIPNNLFASGPSFANFTIFRTNTLTIGNQNIELSGTLTLSQGVFDILNTTLSFHSGNTPIVKGSGTLTAGTGSSLVFGKAGFTGGNAFSIPNGTFTAAPSIANLTVNRANALTIGNQNLELSGALTLTSGVFDILNTTLTFHTGNTPIVRTAGTLSVGSTGSLIFGKTGFTGGNAFSIPNGTFTTAPSLANLTVNRTNSLTVGDQNFELSGALTLTSGVFDILNTTLTFHSGNNPIGRNGTTQVGTITTGTGSSLVFGITGFTGGAQFTIPDNSFTSGPIVGNFTINRTNAILLGNQGMEVRNLLTLTAGTLNINTGHLNLNGATLSAPAGLLAGHGSGLSNLTITGTPGTGMLVDLPFTPIIRLNNVTISGNRTLRMPGTTGSDLYLYGTMSIGYTSAAVFGTYDNNGESQVANWGGSITVNGKFINRDKDNFTGTGGAVTATVPVTLNSGCTVEYALAGDQVVTSRTDYKNVTFSNSGIKTLASGFNPAGTVYITGAAIVNAGSNTFGDAGTNLTMDGGRLRVGGVSSNPYPNMSGAYNLSAGVVEFYSSQATTQTIRVTASFPFQNIEVTGNNVGNSGGSINLNSGGTFTVKTGGVMTINANAITGPSGAQTVTVESGAKFVCGDADGFSGSTTSVIKNDIETIDLQAGSTVEYSRATAQIFSSRSDYKNVIISGGGPKTLNGAATINESMTFTSGVVNTTSANLLTFENAALVAGTPGAVSYIDGPAAKKMNAGSAAEFVFPLGKAAGTPVYNPAGIAPTSITSTTTFTAEYFVNPNQAQGIMGMNVLGIQNLGYWDISNSVSAGNTARVKLYYTNPGNGNWIYYTGSPSSPYYFTAPNPLFYCNVAVVRRDAGTASWSFTSNFGNFNTTDPESRSYTNNGFIYSHDPTLPFTRFSLGYSINSILPVNLLSFNGVLQGADGKLDWSISNNVDLAGFELQYSRDGRQFSKLADITGSNATSFSFTHQQLPTGANYYRLLVKEKNGNTTLSKIIIVTKGKAGTVLLGLKQNPVKNEAVVLMYAEKAQQVQATVTDLNGRLITSYTGNVAEGNTQLNVPVLMLAKGIYNLTIVTGDAHRKTIRFLKE